MLRFLKSKSFLVYHLFIALIIGVLLTVEDYFEISEPNTFPGLLLEFTLEVPVFFLVALTLTTIAYYVVRALNKNLPWEQQPSKRFFLDLVAVIFLVLVSTLLTLLFVNMTDLSLDGNENEFSDFVGITTIMYFNTMVMVFVYHEFDGVFGEKHSLSKKAEKLERENFIARYEVLKNQVNPHFLFNSLNVLSGLIYEDVKQSDIFIRKFSEVFRYVLELNENELASLKRELSFLDSYLFLQKIRYGECVDISINVPAESLAHELPPMSLQIVIENVFKHNQIGEDYPMMINISIENDRLKIVNTFQPKKGPTTSTGIGQGNLFRRYELINHENHDAGLPEFYIEDQTYVVELPMIERRYVSHSNH